MWEGERAVAGESPSYVLFVFFFKFFPPPTADVAHGKLVKTMNY